MAETRRRRWPRRVVVASTVVVVVAGSGLAYAWHQGWLSDTYRAATRPCPDDVQASHPVEEPPEPLAALEPVAEGLDRPTTVAFHPDPHLDLAYIAQQPGTVLALEAGALQDTPVLDLEGRVSTEFDQGLLGLAVEPDGSHLWAYFTDEQGDSTLVAWALDEHGDVDAASEHRVLHEEQPDKYHNGGALVFGPDGRLHLTLGDGGLLGDRTDNGQRSDTLLGKVLAIDVDHAPATATVSGGARGPPNPDRRPSAPATDALWVADGGHSCIEEVHLVPAGTEQANLGWNRFEGPVPFAGEDPGDHLAPVYWYTHDDGCAVIGGAVARGDHVPALEGRYVLGDYCTGRLTALSWQAGGVTGATEVGVDVPQVLAVVPPRTAGCGSPPRAAPWPDWCRPRPHPRPSTRRRARSTSARRAASPPRARPPRPPRPHPRRPTARPRPPSPCGSRPARGPR